MRYTGYSVQWGAVHALQRTLARIRRNTGSRDKVLRPDSAGDRRSRWDYFGRSSGASRAGSRTPDETASAETSAPAEASKRSAIAAL